jgi:hypothetical protein
VNSDVEWLVQEVDSLLDMSNVGLYEFLWMQRGRNPNTGEDEMRRHAEDALRLLLAAGRGRLVWLKWPDQQPVDEPPISEPGAHDWEDPNEGPYLALTRD